MSLKQLTVIIFTLLSSDVFCQDTERKSLPFWLVEISTIYGEEKVNLSTIFVESALGDTMMIRSKNDSLPHHIRLPRGNYKITVSSPCYLISSFEIDSLESTNANLLIQNIDLTRVTDCGVHFWESVHFNQNETIIDDLDKVYLDTLAQVIISNPDLSFIFEGHTDHLEDTLIGQLRAEEVCNYLIAQGVSPKQLKTENRKLNNVVISIHAIMSLQSEEEKNAAMRLNRRVTYKVTEQ